MGGQRSLNRRDRVIIKILKNQERIKAKENKLFQEVIKK